MFVLLLKVSHIKTQINKINHEKNQRVNQCTIYTIL